jgi:hypothetical protein
MPGFSFSMSGDSSMAEAISKSQMVRDILKTYPDLPIRSVIGALARQGVKVGPPLVYTVKSQMKAKKRRQVRQKVARVVSGNGPLDPIVAIKKVKDLAVEVGGMPKLQQLLDVLS